MMLRALLIQREDGYAELRSPGVGLWREPPPSGTLVCSGARLGRLEVLGELFVVCAPEGTRGLVIEQPSAASRGGLVALARRPVAYDDTLLVLDPSLAAGTATEQTQEQALAASELVFRTPTGGRFYARPAPDKPVFVSEGDIIRKGHTVAILEVMKTFNRVQYGGTGLPDEARVVRVVPADGDDLGTGDVLLEIEVA